MSDQKASRRNTTRVATLVALVTAPIIVLWLVRAGWSYGWAAVTAILAVAAFRGVTDNFFKNIIETPEIFGVNDPDLLDADALRRRRLHFWRKKMRLVCVIVGAITFAYVAQLLVGRHGVSWVGTADAFWLKLKANLSGAAVKQLIILPIFFLFNFLIFMGPMMMMGISQIRGFEPGDAEWGVKLDDVRGQKEAKAEIEKIINLWQSGDKFVKSGGKRERGILFLGAPGTGKTMLAKAIATGFNCPIVTIPGSGFAQTFIGMDVAVVRWMAGKAKRLAAKWGGQCIVFIDEIDAVGMRRASLGGGTVKPQLPGGALGGMMGGGMAINQLLIVMDGIDSPPFLRRTFTNKVNLWLDALYLIPRKVTVKDRVIKLRIPRAKPSGNQIYFIGATNAPLEALDPALTRPGRMGRHIYFRTPTLNDRVDVFDLYLSKVSHSSELDGDDARRELARVTQGYSPADIEQVVSMALTTAHHNGRAVFGREDILEAMVTVEAGTAVGWDYIPEEEKQIAIHEAGHAVCSHIHMKGSESTRLSVKRRGDSGGHHQAVEKEERFVQFRSEVFAELIWGLGSLAAEYTFYGENTQGVGGDLQLTTYTAAEMVGRWGMSPPPLGLKGGAATRARRKLELIGKTLIAAAATGDTEMDADKTKKEALMIGQAYVTAWNTVQANKLAIEKIATRLVAEKEIYGNDLTELLDSLELTLPVIDWTSDAIWPTL